MKKTATGSAAHPIGTVMLQAITFIAPCRWKENRCKAGVARMAILSLAIVSGCAEEQSSYPSYTYNTRSTHAYMKAVQNESGAVTTTVELHTGSGAFLWLSGEDDKLISTLDVAPSEYVHFENNLFTNAYLVSQHVHYMAERRLASDYGLFVNTSADPREVEYFTNEMPHLGASPVRAYVAYERGGHVLTAESSAVLPASFDILAPPADSTISRATALVLTWTNPDPSTTMEVDVGFLCGNSTGYTRHLNLGRDTGSATLSAADYLPAGVGAGSTCHVAFLLQRVQTGSISPEFAGGSFKSVQQRTVQFLSVP